MFNDPEIDYEHTFKKRIKFGIKITFWMLVVLLLGGEHWKLDFMMHKLCFTEGGVTVYEQLDGIALPKDSDGVIVSKLKKLESGKYIYQYGDQFYKTVSQVSVPVERTANYWWWPKGSLTKQEVKYIRNSDEKLLAKNVYFYRSGGSFMPFPEASGNGCLTKPSVLNKLVQNYSHDN